MTLLYVDDDEDDRTIFCEIVWHVDSKCHCLVANGARYALRVITSTAVDVIIVDYQMPDMSGREFLSELKKVNAVNPSPRIYMYSTLMQDFEKNDCKNLGAIDCFQKPGDVSEIAKLVRQVLRP